MFDVLQIHDFFDTATREQVLAQMRSAAVAPATVYGSGATAVQPRVRSVRRVDVAVELRDFVMQRLQQSKAAIEKHFDVTLGACEAPQFLRYESGDFFVAHQDGNTPMVLDDSRHRRISVVIFLDREYGGGELTLHGPYPNYDARHAIEGLPGMLVAFRSETTHEVTPVTDGERWTIVSWYRH
ncbi:MAG TPA: 2OG-Fe(II) oxygenase [Thermoanaerobaculia bacterium]|nr:2OG-Fe(II) oxygenase [Thermoanaerobaculia bacterium]